MGRSEDLTNDTVDAFEVATGQPPNDYEYAQIKILAQEYSSGEENKD
ncbi:hypothetical protein SEA_OLICIOUS_60 [Streptomyces phage Olicious]|uniref:Uncharacterized protein n=7 Tax=Immanueltrevirus immanuel3 TaxID=2846399 RepID=A0A2H5BMQ5_9CAUD|nr:hypothetical protein HWB41_gp39 [Streptomyces phage Immanuel3]AUG87364.1 hypothetical protein SEA_HAUGEANATOR_60 [Streptomyces phage HaugeAnator]AUG87427.1 hypothetical protein SEA_PERCASTROPHE_60 [Streptomyces phage Percastrophe]AUG87492.1 hypothetical protein SEA_ROMERO_60 [Streptomyces phage Romero]AUG87555.1 hypothetical protein SEA_TORITOKI_60 [Streptomyces phage ToriToki]AUG87621.1 hypothetical protein SEA_ZOOBEAR_60 [Streptomyces phage ZooBear]AZF95847.1 hypothetical protein SEA_OLI